MKTNIQYGVLIALTLSLMACGGDDSMMSEKETSREIQSIQTEEKNLESVGVNFQVEWGYDPNGSPKRKYRMHRRYTNRSWSNDQIASALERFATKLQRYLAKHGTDDDSRAKLECAIEAIQRMR